ncbi:MAG: cell division protein FtsA [Holosporaceae bacterium]|jgi:cell division protein FtsA|nr:cell division protein FtsA [Holosporaceae bacterium]
MRASGTVTVLDIGSTKVCCCIANIFNGGHFEIIGVGYCLCRGVEAGKIVDVKSVEKSIANAVENAEKMANFRVKSVYVNVSGKGVKSQITNINLNIGGRIIKSEDLLNVFEYCKQEDGDRVVIHSIPILYSVDSLHGIRDPVGMIANNLNIHMNLITVQRAQLDNLLLCLTRCHLDPIGIVASIFASGLCVMGDDDMSTNQIVIDFGGGTTSIGFFYNGMFSGMEVIPLGGNNITSDIAYGLNMSMSNAERLKTLHGAAFASIQDEREVVFAPTIEDDAVINLQQISKGSLNQIIQPRVEEILNIIRKRVEESSFTNNFSRSVIITGGGSNLTGIGDFANNIMNKKVKTKKVEEFIGKQNVPINNSFSVAVGMIKFAQLGDGQPIKVSYFARRDKQEGFFKKILTLIENDL